MHHLKPTDMQAFIQKYEKCLRSTPNGGPVPIGILVTIDKKPIQYVIDDLMEQLRPRRKACPPLCRFQVATCALPNTLGFDGVLILVFSCI